MNTAKGKTVLITGANGNLGGATTALFLEKGYTVVAAVHTEAAKQNMPDHPRLHVHVVRLDNETEAASFVQASIDTHKKIDAALLLAGGFTSGDIAATPSGEIKQQISLNFDTAYHTARPLLNHMLRNNYGRLLFVGARPAIEAGAGKHSIAYSLSKSLLFKLAEYINAEAKGKNVTATVVVPSTLDTPPNRKAMPDKNPADWVKPQALAEILEFVCADVSSPLRESILKVYNNS